jgi:succinate dehydrogenase flavin-adding protein (antitoxin of CptAB toxin-antitoxin module)
MNRTLITPEELAELKKLLKQADEALVNNVYAKNKIKEALNKLNQ